MSSREVVDAFMKMDAPLLLEAADLTDAEVNSIQNMVGGKRGYENLMQWASEASHKRLQQPLITLWGVVMQQ